jgi:hypothetical protein
MEYDDNNDNIRPPDSVVRERLVDAGWKVYEYDYSPAHSFSENTNTTEPISDDDLQAVLENSRLEYETQYNEWLEQIKQEEYVKRKSKFENIKRQLLRITKVDKHAPVEYTQLLDVLQQYETANTEYAVDVFEPTSLSRMRRVIRSLRVPEEEQTDFLGLFSVA